MGYVNRLRPADVGRRVVVRRWVTEAERGLVPSDVLGVLEAWSEQGILSVRSRSGDLIEIAEQDVLAAKTVPPPARSRRAEPSS